MIIKIVGYEFDFQLSCVGNIVKDFKVGKRTYQFRSPSYPLDINAFMFGDQDNITIVFK